MWPLGSRVVLMMNDLSFLVVNLLGFFIAHEENDAAEEENGGAPADAVRPAEFPYRAIAEV